MFNKSPRPENQEAETLQAEATQAIEMEDGNSAVQSQPSEGAGEDYQGKYQLLQEQFTRLAADFDNYRKRVRDEQESLVKYGAQKSVMELLPVLDNLERATASLSENSDPKVLFKSFSVVQKQLLDGLDAMGVKKIQAVGQPFDPQFHEAVNQMSSAEFPEGTVMYEAQSGYQLHDKVIRPAMVVVSTGSADGAAVEPPQTAEDECQPAENRANPFRK